MAATPIIVFAGIYLAWSYASGTFKKKSTRSYEIHIHWVLHGGKLALQRLLSYHEVRADATILDRAANELKPLLEEAHPNFWRLQCTVAMLEMSGKEDEAVAIIENAVKIAQEVRKLHEAYKIEMLLVEMLIYKGDFKKAFHCECLKHEGISCGASTV